MSSSAASKAVRHR